jgi:hypothetical protein
MLVIQLYQHKICYEYLLGDLCYHKKLTLGIASLVVYAMTAGLSKLQMQQ